MDFFLEVVNAVLPEPQASLLSGILFGVKTAIPRSLYNSLVQTGTLHIIALSGMNITILVNLTARLTLFLGRKASSILTIGLIVIFVWFVGSGPTIIRAAIMGSLSLLSIYFGRRYYALLALFLASLTMLIFDFSLIKNLSFQLSFLATFGIILAAKSIERQNRNTLGKNNLEKLLRPIKENFKVTLSAQLFTMPVILYNFHSISLISPAANLLVEWVMQPIMILGFLTVILGSIWLPLGFLAGWLVWVPLTYLIKVVEYLAMIPGASVKF